MGYHPEYYTRALVLGRDESGEQNARVSVFTQQYGKIIASARSMRAQRSRLSSHFQPMHFVKARFAPRGSGDGFVVIDSVLDDAFVPSVTRRRVDCLGVVRAVDLFAPELEQDGALWDALAGLFSSAPGSPDARHYVERIISRLGFGPRYASCGACGALGVRGFVISRGEFVCERCALSMAQDGVLYL